MCVDVWDCHSDIPAVLQENLRQKIGSCGVLFLESSSHLLSDKQLTDRERDNGGDSRANVGLADRLIDLDVEKELFSPPL